MNNSKRPLGIKPKWVWEAERLSDLANAIERYLDNDLEVPIQWIQEYNELIVNYEGLGD